MSTRQSSASSSTRSKNSKSSKMVESGSSSVLNGTDTSGSSSGVAPGEAFRRLAQLRNSKFFSVVNENYDTFESTLIPYPILPINRCWWHCSKRNGESIHISSLGTGGKARLFLKRDRAKSNIFLGLFLVKRRLQNPAALTIQPLDQTWANSSCTVRRLLSTYLHLNSAITSSRNQWWKIWSLPKLSLLLLYATVRMQSWSRLPWTTWAWLHTSWPVDKCAIGYLWDW